MSKHPIFGELPTYASAEKQEPNGWAFLRVFDDDHELRNVDEVDTAAGWYRQARLDAAGRPIIEGDELVFDRIESANLRLEWAA